MAGPRTRPNYLYTILSLALVLFLLGGLGLLMIYAQRLVLVVQQRVELMAELKDSYSDSDRQQLEQTLSTHPGIRQESIRFVSRTEAAELMQRELGQELLDLQLDNPLRDAIVFNMQSGYLQEDTLAQLRASLRELPAVTDVYYQPGLTGRIGENIRRLRWITLIVAILGLGIAALLIHNTIRLALYANRFLIKNMQLVGATWGYISRPYLIRSVRFAFISSVLAIGGLSLLLVYFSGRLPELQTLRHWPWEGMVYAAMLLTGISISLLSTWYVVNKYLRLRVDDLY